MLNLKNKTERETFINDYKNWKGSNGKKLGVWKSIPELDLSFYRYEFANGAVLIVTVYKNYETVYENHKPCGKEYMKKHRLCLILPESDSYTNDSHIYGTNYHRTYTLEGCSTGLVIDYMTKNRLTI